MQSFKNDEDRQRVIERLQQNMNEEFRATLQYICHRISARGADGRISEAFKSAALDEMAHILYFSDLITKYGGTPRFADWPVDKSTDVKAMLEADIALEQTARDRYGEQLSELSGYAEVVSLIEDVLADEEEHQAELERYLNNMSEK